MTQMNRAICSNYVRNFTFPINLYVILSNKHVTCHRKKHQTAFGISSILSLENLIKEFLYVRNNELMRHQQEFIS